MQCRLTVPCERGALDCPNKCSTEGVTHSALPAHWEECPLQQVECEYMQFDCAAVLQRKELEDHMKTSVHSHLQMTNGKVLEQQVCVHEQEARLQEQEERIQREEWHREGLVF